MRRMPIVYLSAALLAAHAAAAPAPVTVTDGDSGRTIELATGQELRLELAANRSTGYAWEWVDRDASVVALLGEPTYTAPSSGALGAGGTATWRFRAERPGSSRLRLVYRRAWEHGAEPARTLTLTLRVR